MGAAVLQVQYNAEGFIDKNKDLLFRDLVAVMGSSTLDVAKYDARNAPCWVQQPGADGFVPALYGASWLPQGPLPRGDQHRSPPARIGGHPVPRTCRSISVREMCSGSSLTP